MSAFKKQVEAIWREQVAGKHMFHGMGAHDLADPLDPAKDPFADIRPHLFQLIQALEAALEAGFEFTVHEDHSGMSFTLKDIVEWSRRDLEDGGIDFTASYEDGCGYSGNWQGSQLKQNFKYITDSLPERADDPILASCITGQEWAIVAELNEWLSKDGDDHMRVVLWVTRDNPVFDDCTGCLPLGSLETFSRNMTAQIAEKLLPLTVDSVASLLPTHGFSYRIKRPLLLKDAAKIEELGSPTSQCS